jgi:hypothetical protein
VSEPEPEYVLVRALSLELPAAVRWEPECGQCLEHQPAAQPKPERSLEPEPELKQRAERTFWAEELR